MRRWTQQRIAQRKLQRSEAESHTNLFAFAQHKKRLWWTWLKEPALRLLMLSWPWILMCIIVGALDVVQLDTDIMQCIWSNKLFVMLFAILYLLPIILFL